MRQRRVRPLNIRLHWQEPNGAEGFRDFCCVSDAREAVDSAWDDWVIHEIDHPYYPACGRVLDSIGGEDGT